MTLMFKVGRLQLGNARRELIQIYNNGFGHPA
jgi:hypothetical protein